MFYLLEDNRIIDIKNPPFHWRFLKVVINEEDKTISLVCADPRERQQFKIKKRSENVYDLIEEGDLVKYSKYAVEDYYIEEVIDVISTHIFVEVETPTEYVSEDNILAIYKPNSKGDYIKVWEKK